MESWGLTIGKLLVPSGCSGFHWCLEFSALPRYHIHDDRRDSLTFINNSNFSERRLPCKIPSRSLNHAPVIALILRAPPLTHLHPAPLQIPLYIPLVVHHAPADFEVGDVFLLRSPMRQGVQGEPGQLGDFLGCHKFHRGFVPSASLNSHCPPLARCCVPLQRVTIAPHIIVLKLRAIASREDRALGA